MNEEKFKNYTRDLWTVLKEKAIQAKIENDLSKEPDAYQLGYQMALYEVVDIMKQEADAFNIDPKDIGILDFEPDQELL